MNFTRFPNFFSASSSVGMSSRQLGHHVAQNSISIGVFPMYRPRSICLPSRDCTVTAGACAPTSMPRSCASAGVPANDATARSAVRAIFNDDACSFRTIIWLGLGFRMGPGSDEEKPHLNKVILRNAQHDQREQPLDP